jgi:glycine/D-amino acid oxidase-like deaminating enzyme
MTASTEFDVVIVGASIAGCAAAALYGRRGARVALVERNPLSDFSTGRPLNPIERTMFAAAARDDVMARHLFDNASRQIGPLRFLAPPALARAAWVNARHRHDPPVAA